ncbi:MAG: GNAT family N-acetyltransferase [Fibrobacter sp.]|nr:GNAT family N-acetyltransferase [Fibrobacter sp.]
MINIQLRQLTDNDISIVSKWLEKKYIKRWLGEPAEWVEEMKLRNSKFSFITHKIVMLGNTAIGFCQYYDYYFAQEDWYAADTPNEIFSIDYLIGEENCLRKGFGIQIVKLLVSEIKQHTNASKLIVQPEYNNTASRHTLVSSGFEYNTEGCYYYLELM